MEKLSFIEAIKRCLKTRIITCGLLSASCMASTGIATSAIFEILVSPFGYKAVSFFGVWVTLERVNWKNMLKEPWIELWKYVPGHNQLIDLHKHQ